jgi:hypothetical protein
VLGTNPWFKKPRAIGEKVEIFGMVLKVRSGERSKEGLKTVENRKSSHSLFLKIPRETVKNRH